MSLTVLSVLNFTIPQCTAARRVSSVYQELKEWINCAAELRIQHVSKHAHTNSLDLTVMRNVVYWSVLGVPLLNDVSPVTVKSVYAHVKTLLRMTCTVVVA